MPPAPTVFISYSHKDEIWKDRLVTHLSVLEHRDLLQTWNDRDIGAGDEWFEEIRKGMDAAKVAVLLISANFLRSKFILHTEVPHLLERREREGMIVFPVICKDSLWQEIPWLAELQARPRDGRALASFRGHRIDAELTKVAKEILEIIRTGEVGPFLNPSHELLNEEPAYSMHLTASSSNRQVATERQLQIAEQHNKLLEAQLQPLFRFVRCIRCVGSESFDALELWNDGSPIESYQIFQASYIQVTRTELVKNERPTATSRLIPCYYFIRRDYQGDARTGLLVALYAWRDSIGQRSGVNMTKEYERLEAEVREKYSFSVSIQKRVFLQIYYIDRTGTSKDVTYEIYPAFTGYGPQVPVRRKISMLGMHFTYELKDLNALNLFDHWSSFQEADTLSAI